MVMDETLYQVQAKVQNFAVIYLGEFEVCLRVKRLCDVEGGWVGLVRRYARINGPVDYWT
jgi:hypothetical protein